MGFQNRSRRASELTIKDRLNFSFILGEYEIRLPALLDVTKDPSLNELRAFVSWVIHTIPEAWKDEKFKTEMKNSKVKIIEDIRPKISGVSLSEKYCKLRGIKTTRKRTITDPMREHQAIINLLNRRGLLSRVKYQEVTSGKKYDKNKPDEMEIDETEILPELNLSD